MDKILIKDKYNLKEETKNLEYSLPLWYNEMINKTVDEINLLDINRMIRQNILVEVALKRAVEEMLKDPFVGEQLEGDVLEHVLKLDDDLLKKYTKEFHQIILKAYALIDSYKLWMLLEMKDEYLDNLKLLEEKVKLFIK